MSPGYLLCRFFVKLLDWLIINCQYVLTGAVEEIPVKNFHTIHQDVVSGHDPHKKSEKKYQ